MAEFVEIPVSRLAPDTLSALLEEFASRDGTDYGLQELSLEEKVAQLRSGLTTGHMTLLYDAESEHWDVLQRQDARQLLGEEG